MNILVAFALTLVAGLCTGIGGFIIMFMKRNNKRFLSVSLGFSAGVMVYVSMVEILAEAKTSLTASLSEIAGNWVTVAAFFGGMLLIAVIDKLIPSAENPHEVKHVEDENSYSCKSRFNLKKLGVMTALAIAIHNFPEGLASFVSALQDPGLAIPVIFAIAIHNIPEGISVSVPIYQATGSRLKALRYSFLSGLAEPLGALAGWLILMPFMNDTVFGVIFAAIAGIMVFISFDELLPAAHEYGEHHLSIFGLISGMAVMAVSLLLFL